MEKQQSRPKAIMMHKGSSVAKRELFTLGAILLGLLATFASGGIVAVAMNGQEERRQINLLGEKVEEVGAQCVSGGQNSREVILRKCSDNAEYTPKLVNYL